MKSLPIRRPVSPLCALVASLLTWSASPAAAQSAKSHKSAKTSASKAAAAKTGAKTSSKPGTPTKFDQHLAAHMKLFRVLSHYAEALSEAKDAATAHAAVTKLEGITRDAITAGEEIVKLGKPDAQLEAKLAVNPDLKMTAQTVAEQTRAAVKSLAENAEVKAILAPSVENFQAALNRVQEAADEPSEPAEEAPATPAAKQNSPQPASEATSVPPPPPQ